MPVTLSENDNRMLNGQRGPAAQMAMRIVARACEAFGASELMDVTQAHIDGCGLLSEAGLEFAEKLAGLGAKVAVPTTLNMGPLDLANWRRFGVPEDFAQRAIRQARAYEQMGCIPTWTCAPYQWFLAPRFAQQIAWFESNAICYANSVLGARTNRYGDYIDICCAITGRVPKAGLHLAENRRGQVLVRLVDLPGDLLRQDWFYPVLGHWLGPAAGEKIAVIEGLGPGATSDQLKGLCAAAASSGAVALFHAVGLTPEAPTREAAFGGRQPEAILDFGPAELAEARRDLSTADDGEKLDVVVVGCPHFSFDEFRRLAELLRGLGRTRFHPGVRFLVLTSRQSLALAERTDWFSLPAVFGVEITLDTCVFHTPLVREGAKVLMTDSGKCAYYAPGELGLRVAFGSLADCVRSAAAGEVRREEAAWSEC